MVISFALHHLYGVFWNYCSFVVKIDENGENLSDVMPLENSKRFLLQWYNVIYAISYCRKPCFFEITDSEIHYTVFMSLVSI